MTLGNVLTLLFGSGVLVAFGKYIIGRLKDAEEKNDAVGNGVQALLRDRLYQSYDHYMEKGYAPIYAKENFLNMYNQYHTLGANGVMDNHYTEFMNLPDKPVN